MARSACPRNEFAALLECQGLGETAEAELHFYTAALNDHFCHYVSSHVGRLCDVQAASSPSNNINFKSVTTVANAIYYTAQRLLVGVAVPRPATMSYSTVVRAI